MNTSFRILCALLVLVVLPPAVLAQSGNPYLDAGMRLYGDFEYEAALDQLAKASSFAGNTPQSEVQIAVYRGLIKSELGDLDGAQLDFKTALAFDPEAQLPPGVSPKIRDVFEQARRQMLLASPPKTLGAPAAPAPLPLPPLTSPEPAPAQTVVIIRPRPQQQPEPTPAPEAAAASPAEPAQVARPQRAELSARALEPEVAPEAVAAPSAPAPAAIAPATRGSRVLAAVLLGAGAALGGGGAFFGYQSSRSVEDARAAHFQSDGTSHLDRARGQALAANVLYGAATAAVIGGFVALFAD